MQIESNELKSLRGISANHRRGRGKIWIAVAALAIGNGSALAAADDVDEIMPPLPTSRALPIRSAVASVAQSGEDSAETAQTSVPAEFARFRADDAQASFEQVANQGGVKDAAEFARMRRYVDNAYAGITVTRTIHTADGQIYDCIPIRQQPALRNGAALATPPDIEPPDARNADPAAHTESCGSGTIPFARLDIRKLARYSSLQAFLHQGKQASSHVESADIIKPVESNGHCYAVMALPGFAYGYGAGASLNLWTPNPAPSSGMNMSLSQIWLVGANTATGDIQSLEVGWQVQPAAWGTNQSVPFVYSTQDSYKSKGCYNLLCSQFVQVSSSTVFASPFASNQYSVTGGNQTLMAVSWYWDSGSSAWWLNINNSWVGYYPASLYSGGSLASGGNSLQFQAGGEEASTTAGGAPNLPMGSGQFAASGYQNAAFIANMYAWTSSGGGNFVSLAGAIPNASDPTCYTLAVAGGSPWLFLWPGVSTIAPNPQMTANGFYFGGPGCP